MHVCVCLGGVVVDKNKVRMLLSAVGLLSSLIKRFFLTHQLEISIAFPSIKVFNNQCQPQSCATIVCDATIVLL